MSESGKSITFQGAGASTTIIDANGTGSVFVITSGVTAIFDDVKITDGGTAGSLGGGIKATSTTLTVTDSVITGNIGFQGAGIYVSGGSATITNSTISSNTAAREGGGLYAQNATVTISGSTFQSNATTSRDGGGIFVSNTTTSITNTSVTSNTAAARSGGGIYSTTGTLAISGGSITSNSSRTGGGVYLHAPSSGATITGVSITSNGVSGGSAAFGGGIYATTGSQSLTVTESTLSSNTAAMNGAGIYSAIPLSVVRSTVSGNIATADGGGIQATVDLTVTNSTITGNSAVNGAGLLWSAASGSASLVNVTLVSNTATTYGGGVYSAGNVSLLNTILGDNSAGSGTSADFYSASNSISSQGYNLFSSSSTNSYITGTTTGNQVQSNLKLDSLANNGGPTYTRALQSGSPAIDAATMTGAPSVDQRNKARSGSYDVGAYEVVSGPVATADSYNATEDTTLNVSASGVLGNDSGSSLTAILVNDVKYGSLTLNSNGSFSYLPDANHNGSDSFDYKANDGSSDSSTVTVTISIAAVNDAPDAVADTGSKSEDAVLTVSASGVLGNDTDVDGDSPTVTSSGSTSTEGAKVTVNSDGSYSYDPTAASNLQKLHSGQTKVDTFNYTISDGKGGSDSATVSITVNGAEDTPVAANDSYSTNEDTKLSAITSVLANDSDADDGDTAKLTVALDKGPSHGTLKLNSDGTFDYEPDANYNGADSFTYTATDGGLTSTSATVNLTINAVNNLPVAAGDSYETDEDTKLSVGESLGVKAGDSDADGDKLSFSVVAGPTNGKLTLNSDGSFDYVPNANHNGTDSFTYKAYDGVGDSNVATVALKINAVNDSPTATGDEYETDEDTKLSVNSMFGLHVGDSDVEGSALSFVIVDDPANGELTLGTGGAFEYVPVANYHGTDSFTYKAYDGAAYSSVVTVDLTINSVNDAPSLSSTLEPVEVAEDSTPSEFVLTGVFSDPDGDTLTYSVEDNDNESLVTASIVSGKLVLTYSADSAGEAEIVVRATDPSAAYEDMFVQLTVNAGNDAPTVQGTLPDLLVSENASRTTRSLEGLFGDVDIATQGDALVLTASSEDPGLVEVTVVDDKLVLEYGEDETGVTEITITATDDDASFVEYTFQVTVGDSSQQDFEDPEGEHFPLVGGIDVACLTTVDFGSTPPEVIPQNICVSYIEIVNIETPSDCPTCPPQPAASGNERENRSVGGVNFSYNSANNPHPIVSFELKIPASITVVPETVEAKLDFGGITTTPVFYDLSNIDPGDTIQISLQVDASSLPTGNYQYYVELIEHLPGGGTADGGFTGNYQLFNWADSPFGNRWSLSDFDRLDIEDDGVAYLRGDGIAMWFAQNPLTGNFTRPDGNFSQLVEVTDGYVLTSIHGEKSYFDSEGMLRKREDANGNLTEYSYYDVAGDGFADEPAFVRDVFGRTTEFKYAGGKLTSITDFAGRVTSFEYNGNKLEQVIEPDPDGSGPGLSPVTEYQHDSAKRITKIIDPVGNEYEFDFDFAGLLEGGINPDGSVWFVDPQIKFGLVDPLSGSGTSTNPEPAVLVEDAIGSFTDTNGLKTYTKFDRLNQPVEVIDPQGNVFTWERDPDGRATDWTLPDPDDLTSRSGTNGILGELVYSGDCDVCGNRTEIIYPDGAEEHWTYENTFNHMTTYIDQMGRLTRYDYTNGSTTVPNLQGIQRVVGLPDGEGNSETDDLFYTFTYTDGTGALPAGLLLREIDPLGRETRYLYDSDLESHSFGWVIEVTMAFGTADEATTGYEYDLAGNVTAITDPLDRRTEMAYDSLDRLIFITGEDPDGPSNPLTSPVTSFVYDAIGRLISLTNPLGHVTTYAFADEERTQTITLPDPDGAGPLTAPESILEFDLAGNLSKLTDPLDRITTYFQDYEELEQIVTLPDPDGIGSLTSPTQKTVYDNLGNVHTTTDALGNVTTYEYDKMSRLIKMTLPDPDGAGSLTAPDYEYEYFLDGQLKSVTDPLDRKTSYTYDEDLGWLTSVTQPDPDGTSGPLAAPVTFYEYDAVGNLTKVTEPSGAVTEYEYDNLDRMVKTTSPDPDGVGSLTSPVTEYEYDAASQLVSVVDGLGRETTYDYDGLGRQSKVTLPDPDGAGSLTSPVISYTYDAANRLLTTIDPLGNVSTYAYDNLDRLLSVTQPDPDGGGSLTAPVTSYTYDAASQLLTVIDPLGRATSYAYDGLGRHASVTQPDPDGMGPLTSPITYFEYDAENNLLSVTDPLGNVTSSTYDKLHRRIGMTLPDPDGAGSLTSPAYAYAFNAASELVSVTDPLSRVTSYVYDALGRLSTLTLPDPDDGGSLAAPVYSYTYNDALDLIAETDPLSNVTAYTYDKLHRRVGVTQADPDGAGSLTSPVWSYAFDAASQLTSQTDPLSRVTSYGYDNLGRLKTLTQPDPDGVGSLTSPVTSYGYDAASNLQTVTDPLGRVTNYDYDNLHRQTKVTLPDPDGVGSQTSPEWNYSYDAANQVLLQSDPLSRVTSYAYDNLGRLQTLTQPDPDDGGSLTAPVTTFAYDAAGNVQQMTDARGYVTDYDYDNLYRRTKVTLPDPDGGGSQASPVWEYSFDSVNQLIDQTDPMDRTTGFAYDKLGRLLSVTQPDPDGGGSLAAPVSSYGYDAVGNLLTVTDPLSHVTTYGYDKLYRRTSITDALSGVTSFTFDAAGQLKTLTDPVSNTTEWFYDNLGRVIEEENELGKSRFFEYDSVGNLTQRTDRNGRVIQYVYDNLNRNTDEKWYADSSLVRTIDFEFDAANQLLSVEDPSATNHFTYDKLGRVSLETQTIVGFDDTITLAQQFDALGNRTRAEMNYGTSATQRTDYVYDGLSRMTQQTQYDSTSTDIAWKRATFQYNAASQFSEINRFAGHNTTPIAVATSTYSYDGIGRLTDLLHFTDTTTWAGYEYEYDAASRIAAIDSFVDGLTEYDYDNTNQLTDADHASLTDEHYSYDANGNRTMSGYTIGDNNELESDGTYNYAYDDEGNRISRTNIATGYVTEYTWDHRNRLVTVTEYDEISTVLSTVEYTYDAFDRWVSRSYDADGPSGSAAIDTIFSHDGDQISLEFAGETTTVDGDDLSHIYSWGPAIDQLLADEAFGAEPLWALSDHLGTPRDLIAYNEIAEVTELRNHRAYDSFGQLASQSSVFHTTQVGYSGRHLDSTTGLGNHRNRWLDFGAGIWISSDPIGFNGLDANLQRYVFNSPSTHTDPFGLEWWNPQTVGEASQTAGTIAAWVNPVTSGYMFMNHFVYQPVLQHASNYATDSGDEFLLESASAVANANANMFAATSRPDASLHALVYPVSSTAGTLVDTYGMVSSGQADLAAALPLAAANNSVGRPLVAFVELSTNTNLNYNDPCRFKLELTMQDAADRGTEIFSVIALGSTLSPQSRPQVRPSPPRPASTQPTQIKPTQRPHIIPADIILTGKPPNFQRPAQTRPAQTSPALAETRPANYVEEGIVHQQQQQARPKPVNLPSLGKLTIDMPHIASGHMPGGSRLSPNKTVFPSEWTLSQVEGAIREAYRNGSKVYTQGERVVVWGDACGIKVEIWVNLETKVIESAYPRPDGK